ncbi:MAG TPA: hypothetical protein VHL34_14290 [Rhizomicrobium sp.]|nr:hypothetical protein [Rhizomicrobium sp.]
MKVFPPQESRAAHPLHIDTENGEITIGFDFYHAHWEWPSSDDHRNPVRYLSDLLDEKIVVASFWRGDEWKGSTMVDAGVTDIPAVSAAAELLRLRSWRGTFSSDLALSGAAA